MRRRARPGAGLVGLPRARRSRERVAPWESAPASGARGTLPTGVRTAERPGRTSSDGNRSRSGRQSVLRCPPRRVDPESLQRFKRRGNPGAAAAGPDSLCVGGASGPAGRRSLPPIRRRRVRLAAAQRAAVRARRGGRSSRPRSSSRRLSRNSGSSASGRVTSRSSTGQLYLLTLAVPLNSFASVLFSSLGGATFFARNELVHDDSDTNDSFCRHKRTYFCHFQGIANIQ